MNKALVVICTALMLKAFVFSSRADDLPGAEALRELVDHSDLIIVATPKTVCGGYVGSGPVAKPGEDRLVPSYHEFVPRLKIDQVLKGDTTVDQILRISYTALVVENGKNIGVLGVTTPKGSPGSPVFNVKTRPPDEIASAGSPRMGAKYVFFLENRKKRDPNSYEVVEKEQIIFRNFDFKSGMVAANPAFVSRVTQLMANR